MAQAIARRAPVVGGDVGRIADDGIEAPRAERREPVARQPLDASVDQPLRHCAARPSSASLEAVGAEHLPVPDVRGRGRWRWQPEPVPRSAIPACGRLTCCQHALDQQLGLGARHQHRRRDFEVQRPELAPPQKIGHGFARGAPRAGRGEARRHLLRAPGSSALRQQVRRASAARRPPAGSPRRAARCRARPGSGVVRRRCVLHGRR